MLLRGLLLTSSPSRCMRLENKGALQSSGKGGATRAALSSGNLQHKQLELLTCFHHDMSSPVSASILVTALASPRLAAITLRSEAHPAKAVGRTVVNWRVRVVLQRCRVKSRAAANLRCCPVIPSPIRSRQDCRWCGRHHRESISEQKQPRVR